MDNLVVFKATILLEIIGKERDIWDYSSAFLLFHFMLLNTRWIGIQIQEITQILSNRAYRKIAPYPNS